MRQRETLKCTVHSWGTQHVLFLFDLKYKNLLKNLT